MISRAAKLLLLIAIGLMSDIGLIWADELVKADSPTEADQQAKANSPTEAVKASKAEALLTVKALSDTSMAAMATVFAEQDSALLVSIFPEDIKIAMPGGRIIDGHEEITMYTRLLFETFGGVEFGYKRRSLEFVAGQMEVIFDAGKFALARRSEDKLDTIFDGAYAMFWRMTDSVWEVDRMLVGQDRL